MFKYWYIAAFFIFMSPVVMAESSSVDSQMAVLINSNHEMAQKIVEMSKQIQMITATLNGSIESAKEHEAVSQNQIADLLQQISQLKSQLIEVNQKVDNVNRRTRNMRSDPQGTVFTAEGNSHEIHIQNDRSRIGGVTIIGP